ncbi:hypothetical protein K525DRAFT_254454 [Schizophyllum commune Loenen D]|nr:hypothetical protein K525DRAFT_254454 [Schizophyllum commune Loenen D]
MSVLSQTQEGVPILHSLPWELMLEVFELVIQEVKPSALLCLSRTINAVIEAIIYRTVVLPSPQAVFLFHQSVSSKPPAFHAAHVLRLYVTYSPSWHAEPTLRRCLRDILTACGGIRELTLPTGHGSIARQYPTLTHLTVGSFEEEDKGAGRKKPAGDPSAITHLRICEPASSLWCPPIELLKSFGKLPALTHLQLPRRMNANEENDELFARDVGEILRRHPKLKMLIVSLFHAPVGEEVHAEETNIFRLLRKIDDERLVLERGREEEWQSGRPFGWEVEAIPTH